MTEEPPTLKQKRKEHTKKKRRKALILTTVTLNDLGWFSSMYFWWVEPNMIGLALAIVMIFASDMMLALMEY